MTEVSMLFDVGVESESGRVVVTIASEMGDTEQDGVVLRLTRDQADSLVGKLTDALAVTVDVDALALLVATAEWESDGNDGERAYFRGSTIADALAWECGSCRPDVGWAEHSEMQRSAEGEITLYVECGHCGYQMYFDTEGNQLDDR